MIVFVINKHGEPLMPCKPRKARKLLDAEKAKIVSYRPFTIQIDERALLPPIMPVINGRIRVRRALYGH